MTAEDRELLALAAKAAGYTILRFSQFDFIESCRIDVGGGWEATWNPLVNDGDALRLAVRLELDLIFYGEREALDPSLRQVNAGDNDFEIWEKYGDLDRSVVTRRAIVRAAAAIGEQA